MEIAAKRLRPYQVRLVTDVCRATEDVLVEQPTGSGKTVQIVTLVAMQLGQRFSHAVISAPQEQIEQAFVKRDYQVVAFPDCPGVAVPPIQVPKALIKGARESKLGSVKRVIHYLRQPGPLDHAFACTHAALNRLTGGDLPEDLSGKALFIDEAHHASADGLSEVVTLWRERGGQLFFFTATPYRGDGRPVRLEGMRAFRRSLAEHMAEGFAPRHLESEIVALGQPGDTITAGQFTGEETPPSSYVEGLVAAICRRWLEDGKPKTIVRVPPMQGGRSGELVCRLLQALRSQGARVLDATGTGGADKQRFLTALEAEKNRTHATSAYDVIVGIQRVLEGTDWPVCGAVYCVGMPGSLNTVVQFLGRAMRLKGEDYPAEQRDRARLVFFVPCGGGAALADLSIDHSRHALLTCCFLADHEVGQEWIVLREVRRGIEAALGTRTENPAAADAENEADEALDPEVRAEVELVMANAREQIISSGGEPTVGEVVQLAAKTRPDLPEAALHRVAAEILAAQATSTGAAVPEAIQQEIATRLRIDPMVKQAMAEAFAVVVEEFRDVTLNNSAVLENVGRQVHGVTGGQMQEFAQRLRDAAPRPLTEEQILAWADAHYTRAGTWPGVDGGAIEDANGETWSDVDRALRRGLRSLPGGSSLSQLLAEKRSARNRADLDPLTEEQILVWADAHHQRTGEWPGLESGIIQEAPGETWKGINHSLRLGSRSLSGGSSIAKLLEEKRGVRNLSNLPVLTEEQILAWADEQFQSTGEWPKVKAESINGAPGETWSAINVSLELGGRGLPGGSSLAKLLAKHRRVRNIKGLPPLTERQILVWADEHHGRTGEWPKMTSGAIPQCPGETWMMVQNALQKGLRGLPGGSSLAQLLAKHREVRNRVDPPRLTVEQVLAWADAAFQRTGQWPNQYSGPIMESPEETWAGVNYALKVGTRGLPGGRSLAQILSDQRGVRNRGELPQLSIEQILVWADVHFARTGKWPNWKSGVIVDAPGETWSGVQSALFFGRRGFLGGTTLAQLLQSHRGVRNIQDLPRLSEDQIILWAEAYHRRIGQWPSKDSGPIDGAPGETWNGVQIALLRGRRGLPGGSSLARLIADHCENVR
jgi:superfamily II DNA or RNA helicase